MNAVSLALLDPAVTPVLDGPPAQALLDLKQAVRGGVPLVVMSADPSADRALDDPRTMISETLGDEPGTRLIGPASGGLSRGPGKVALVSALGPLLPSVLRALGDRLGLAIDLGLAWDVSAAEVLEALAGGDFDTIGLAIPDDALSAPLARGLRVVQGRCAVIALAAGDVAAYLGRYGVATAPDLAGFVRALAATERPLGPRVALVSGTGPLAAFLPSAIAAAGLTLAEPSETTAAHLRSELPMRTVLTPLVQIPGATARHVEVAREALDADAAVDHVLAFDLPGSPPRDPFAEGAHLARLVALSETLARGPSPLVPDVDGSAHVEAVVAASLLMRRVTLDRASSASLLASLDDALTVAPAMPVASLAAAARAARQLGYPVLLPPSLDLIGDEATLTTRWELLVDDARGHARETSAPRRMDHDPFAARVVVHASSEIAALRYSAVPLPTVRYEGHTLALPLRAMDLEGQPIGLRPALRALSRLCVRAPEIAAMTLVLDSDGTLLHAGATLTEAEAALK